jgi:hypothetical protein
MNIMARPVRDRAALVRNATRITRELGFTNAESIKMLGYSEEAAKDPACLERESVGNKGADIEMRCDRIIEIKARLYNRFRENTAEIRRWLKRAHPQFKGMSAHSFMASGKISDLNMTIAMLRNLMR